jgi:hypothetical protein
LVASTLMNGALASCARRRAISVLPTPVAAPPVTQRDRHGALGVRLSDDVPVQFLDDFAGGHL